MHDIGTGPGGDAVRVAAVGDLHMGVGDAGRIRNTLHDVIDHADVLLVAGDLTRHGTRREARIAGEELADLGLPVVAVLGNHDHHSEQPDVVTHELEASGVHVLEADGIVLELHGHRVGIAGLKGFGGGFRGACASDFGEPEMKSFVQHTKARALQLQQALHALETPIRIALLHYAPIVGTLEGERPEIHAFLGSYFLEDAIDAVGVDVAFHGHAHKGLPEGRTARGAPVYNVAREIIGDSYVVVTLPALTAARVP